MRAIKFKIILTTAWAISFPQSAQGANWLALQGYEPAAAPSFRLFGFAQGVYQETFGTKVRNLSGPLAPYNGKYALFNAQEESRSSSDFVFRRARLGARGRVHERVNYTSLFEFGTNPSTRESAPAPLDLSVTVDLAPGPKLRIGRFKLPLLDETLEAVHLSSPFINYSSGAAQLLHENRLAGTGSAYRDAGFQLFDWKIYGVHEFSYAAALTYGGFKQPERPAPDRTLRLSYSRLTLPAADIPPWRRQEFSVFVFHSQGERELEQELHTRLRQGFGVHFLREKFRIRAEALFAKGMIEAGLKPSFWEGEQNISTNGKGRAWSIMASYFPIRKLEVAGRYDTLDRDYDSSPSRRVFNTWTLAGKYYFKKNLHGMLSYEFRELKAPENANENVQEIVSSMGNRLAAQLTAMF